jgi:hypothetical protein
MRYFYLLLPFIVLINTLAANAQNWSTPVLISDMPGINNNQDMCIDRAGTRHVVWSHKVTGGYWTIMYTKSTTGGTTWSTPDTIVNIPGAWLYEPHIVSDTLNNLFVSFDSISQGGSFGQVYLKTKQGEQWGTHMRISNEYELAVHQLMTIDGNNRLYIFWNGYYNQNAKFIYKYLENGVWSTQIIPFVDSNYYSLRSVKTDKLNNILCNGLFKYFGQGGSYPRVFYTKYESVSNSWQTIEDMNIYNSDHGCDIAIDTALFPNLVWGQYTNTAYPFEHATIFKKQNLWGWGDSDTITKDEEYNQKMTIDKNNTVHIIDCYVLPDNNTLTTFNYYTIAADGWSKEILDENGSIIMFDIETTNVSVDIVYVKMIAWPGPDSARTYYINKSILVGLPQTVGKGQPLFVYPNPCNAQTTIEAYPPKPIPVSLFIVDVNGKMVKTFFVNKTLSHKIETIWDLTGDNARLIPSGTYLLVLKSEKFIYVKQIIKL